ncbi:hypothetical protein BGX34_012017 [Mortierella sp. NVP85]|nr:hypothetical protein BGX34_012017 [Mortierella sp. NVP85]
MILLNFSGVEAHFEMDQELANRAGKHDDRYFDRIGPTLLTLGLLVTYAINVVLSLQVTSKMTPEYQPSMLYNAHQTPAVSAIAFPVASPMVSLPVLNTPRLLPGSGIAVGGTDNYADDEDDEGF